MFMNPLGPSLMDAGYGTQNVSLRSSSANTTACTAARSVSNENDGSET